MARRGKAVIPSPDPPWRGSYKNRRPASLRSGNGNVFQKSKSWNFRRKQWKPPRLMKKWKNKRRVSHFPTRAWKLFEFSTTPTAGYKLKNLGNKNDEINVTFFKEL